jgi:alkylresorcinol/alkylpyrone synthase
MAALPWIVGTQTALPPNYATQEVLSEALRARWSGAHFNPARLDQLHRTVCVGGRHLALPLEEYDQIETFEKSNNAWIRVGLDLAEQAVGGALQKVGLNPRDVDHLFFTTVTGLAVPSLDARLVNRLQMRPDMKRTPMFGLGCAGGAAGLARASDYLRAFPDEIAVLLSVELCSLTLQREDLSIPNIIATGLFGDGAAAAVLGGGNRQRGTGPSVVAGRTVLYPNTERVMGWDIVDSGFKIVLSAEVPQVVKAHLRQDVEQFLHQHGRDLSRIKHVICHTGGPKVLDAVEAALELPVNTLERSRQSLKQIGNLSSASVLFVLQEMMESGEAKPGDEGLLVAMGPAFGSEMVLLQW